MVSVNIKLQIIKSYTYIHTHTHTYIHTHIYTNTHTHLHTQSSSLNSYALYVLTTISGMAMNKKLTII